LDIFLKIAVIMNYTNEDDRQIVTRVSVIVYIALALLLSIYPILFLPSSVYSQKDINVNDSHMVIKNLSNNTGDSVYAQISSYKNNVYAVWQDNVISKDPLNYDILIRKSNDGGVTYGGVVNLSNNTGLSEHPQIAVSGNNVYVVWVDNTSGNREIYFVRSTDGGVTYSKITNLSMDTTDSHNQEIAAFGDNVYVVWTDNSKILFRASTNRGATFNDLQVISNDVGKPSLSYPKIAVNEDNVYVVWDVYNETNNNDYPIANDNGGGGIFFTKSTDNDNHFGQIIRLNHDIKYGKSQIDAKGNNVYVVWSSSGPHASSIEGDNNNRSGIFFTKSTDTGNTFKTPISIDQQFKNPSNVQIVQDKNEVYIAAQGFLINNTPIKNEEIFLINGSSVPGDIFQRTVNISNNSGVSECPSLAVYGNKLYMTWEDNTPGNHEILFSTKTLQTKDFQ
jgi:hypothetical protein